MGGVYTRLAARRGLVRIPCCLGLPGQVRAVRSARVFFDIVFKRRDAWAAVMLSGLVSDTYGPLPGASYMYHSVSAFFADVRAM